MSTVYCIWFENKSTKSCWLINMHYIELKSNETLSIWHFSTSIHPTKYFLWIMRIHSWTFYFAWRHRLNLHYHYHTDSVEFNLQLISMFYGGECQRAQFKLDKIHSHPIESGTYSVRLQFLIQNMFELYERSFVLRFTFSIAHESYVTRSKYCIHSMTFIHYDKRQKQNAIRRSRDLMYLQFNKLYKINRDC